MTAIGFRYPLLAVVGAGVFAAAPLATVLAVKLVTAPDPAAPLLINQGVDPSTLPVAAGRSEAAAPSLAPVPSACSLPPPLDKLTATPKPAPAPAPAPALEPGAAPTVVDTQIAFSDNGLAELATQARIVPAFENGKVIGFKLFSIRPGSLYAKAGLHNGDVVRCVNGQSMLTPENALQLYTRLKDTSSIRVDIRRKGQDLTLDYDVDGNVASMGTTAPLTFSVDDMNMHTLAQNARIAPVWAGKRSVGFKLYDLTPDGLFAQAGLKDGDIIRRVNGIDTTSPAKALEAYQVAKASDIVVIEFLRDGVAGTLSYKLR